ncbi:MAG TPA: DUF5615 family PIN-like protein [Bacteroidia bacterium]
MVFVFDENYSYKLVEGLRNLELGNKHSKPAEIWHILELAKHLKITPKSNIPNSSFSDEEVIIIAGKQKGIVITQDKDFRNIKHKGHLYKEHNVGVIFFKTVIDTRGYWGMVTSIINKWYELKQKAEHASKPFCFFVDHKGIKPNDF